MIGVFMMSEQRVDYLEKEVKLLKKQLEDHKESTSRLMSSLHSELQSASIRIAEKSKKP